MRSFRLGITGKIGSGKSFFSGLLRENGITVLDTDSIAKEVMANDPEVRELLISLFGPRSFVNDQLDTKYLASQLFSDPEKRLHVESIVHPKVTERLELAFEQANVGEIIGVESALLMQTGYDELFDAVVLISSSDEAVIDRNRKDGKFSEQDLLLRLAEQAYSKELEDDADFIISNDSDLETFREKCLKVFSILTIMALGALPDAPLRTLE